MADPSKRPRIAPPRRKDAFKRFLFSNGISLTTLAAVLFNAGVYKERFVRVEEMTIVTAARADDIQRTVNKIENRISGIDADVTNLKDNHHECHATARRHNR